MTLTEFPQVQALSPREKLELVDEIWKSAASSIAALEVTQEEKELLDQRWNDFLRNPESSLTVDEFKIRLHTLRA